MPAWLFYVIWERFETLLWLPNWNQFWSLSWKMFWEWCCLCHYWITQTQYLVFEAEVCSTLNQELHNLKVTFLCSIKHSTPTWGLERHMDSTYHSDGQLGFRSFWDCLGATSRVCNKQSKLVTLRFSRKHVKCLVLIYTRKGMLHTWPIVYLDSFSFVHLLLEVHTCPSSQ